MSYKRVLLRPCTLLHPVPSTFTHLHAAPSTSTHLISTSAQLHPTPPKSFQSFPSSLQHPQQYLNRNIARNCAISPTLGRNIQNCPFWLKIGSHGILEVLIPNPDLDFWNSNPKIYFWANLGPKSQTCPFCLKIGTHVISRMLILFPRKLILVLVLVFWISYQKSILGKFGPKKSKLSVLSENWDTWYLEDADSYFNICFLNFKPKTVFWPNLGQKSQICPFCLKIGTLGILRMRILIWRLVFWILKPTSIYQVTIRVVLHSVNVSSSTLSLWVALL